MIHKQILIAYISYVIKLIYVFILDVLYLLNMPLLECCVLQHNTFSSFFFFCHSCILSTGFARKSLITAQKLLAKYWPPITTTGCFQGLTLIESTERLRKHNSFSNHYVHGYA